MKIIKCKIDRHDSKGYCIGTIYYDFDGNAIHECPQGVTGDCSESFDDEQAAEMVAKAARLIAEEWATWEERESCKAYVALDTCDDELGEYEYGEFSEVRIEVM